MIKWLENFKLKVKLRLGFKIKDNKANPSAQIQAPVLTIAPFCLEIRVDDEGLIYFPASQEGRLEIDPEAYSQICQAVGSIALTEMRDKSRVLH